MLNYYITYIAAFEMSGFYSEIRFKRLHKLREKFVRSFDSERINTLTIDEYIVGKNSKSSFCYIIEQELSDLGNIKGGYANKFGLYYEKENARYYVVKKFGKNENDALVSIKCAIQNLLVAGRTNDYKSIDSNLLSPMFKGKILSVYFPNQYLTIFSDSHLDYFLNQLNVKYNPRTLTQIEKSLLLIDIKDSTPYICDWSLDKFAKFLYYLFGNPTSKKIGGVIFSGPLAEKVFCTDVASIEYEYVDLKIAKKMRVERDNNIIRKVDFNKRNEELKRNGDRGELIVLQSEYACIDKTDENNTKILHVSNYDDSLGYDIEVIDENNLKKYIEVKSTVKSEGDFSFYISSNEYKVSQSLSNYWFYFVFSVHTNKPKIWRVPAKDFYREKKNFILRPNQYLVNVKTIYTNG